ncbi:hypothetical protein ACH0C8_00515 [Acetobacter lovaniensis]|jgi:hypothetical protein
MAQSVADAARQTGPEGASAYFEEGGAAEAEVVEGSDAEGGGGCYDHGRTMHVAD